MTRVWKSDEMLLVFASFISLTKINFLGSHIKHSTECFITRSNTLKFVENSVSHVGYLTPGGGRTQV